MKKRNKLSEIYIYATTFLLSAFCLASCGSEEKLGLNPADNVAPGSPTVVKVRSIAGGAIITFAAPKDDDLLCVKASYTVNGIEHITKASPYVDTLRVEGFGEAGSYPVKLQSVDKSKNESEPIEITIDAATPPVLAIYNSLKVIDSFGGVKIFWENESEANVIIEVSKKEGDDWVSLENFYSSAKEASGSIRGQEPEPIMLRYRIRDRWDNYSPYLEKECLPLEEKELDKKLFKQVDALPGDSPALSDTYSISKIWDGNTTANCFHGPTSAGYSSIGRTVTFDMGQEAKLSRFKMWQRTSSDSFIYSHNNLKHYIVYGCNELTSEMYTNGGREDADGGIWPTFNGWTELLDVYCYKPSGDSGKMTNEDKEYILGGDEHEFPIDLPKVRYIRVLMLENWSGGIIGQIAEMTFWGQPQAITNK